MIEVLFFALSKFVIADPIPINFLYKLSYDWAMRYHLDIKENHTKKMLHLLFGKSRVEM